MLIKFLNTRFNSGEIVELMFAVLAGGNRATYAGVMWAVVGVEVWNELIWTGAGVEPASRIDYVPSTRALL